MMAKSEIYICIQRRDNRPPEIAFSPRAIILRAISVAARAIFFFFSRSDKAAAKIPHYNVYKKPVCVCVCGCTFRYAEKSCQKSQSPEKNQK